MQKAPKIIIITGSAASGKTTLLSRLINKTGLFFDLDGILSPTTKRPYRSKQKSNSFDLLTIKSKKRLPWARREKVGTPFVFFQNNADIITEELKNSISKKPSEVFIIDNLGKLELKNQGLTNLTRYCLNSSIKFLILSLHKDFLPTLINHFELKYYTLIDLDLIDPIAAAKKIEKNLTSFDGDKIGLFASMTTAIELGLGTTLNAFKIPFKGFFLSSLQNYMLILFGRELKGRGIFWIVLITAGLKSFSVAGNKLRPMIYIFIQGVCFIIPTRLLGLNLISVIIGSIFLGLSTICMSLFFKYLLFGKAFITAYINFFNQIFLFLNLPNWGLIKLLLVIIILRSTFSVIIAFLGYYSNFEKLFIHLQKKVEKLSISEEKFEFLEKLSWKRSILLGLSDIFSIRYFIPFTFASLIIYLFTKMNYSEYSLVIIRGLVISWFSFILARKIDFQSIIHFFEKRDMPHVAQAMIRGLQMISSLKKKNNPRSTTPSNT